ncbi:MAG: hypothetical protein HYZ36_01695, partial [Pedosphaera parvula]|nr:hypothetical protein [Pedosphaera parvula]
MNQFILAGIIGDTATQFGVDWPHFIAQVVSFCIVAALLTKFAYTPVINVLAARRQQIEDSLANAE